MRYLVTGGAGFIGSAVVRRVISLGHEAVVLDDFSTGRDANLAGLSARVLEGCVTDPATVRAACAGCDGVFHLAAVASVFKSMEQPVRCHDVNVTGTLNVLEAARQEKVRRVVLSSSAAVYGEADAFPLSETVQGEPISPYGLHKKIAEQYCRLYAAAGWVEAVCLRYFNVYGPRQDPNGEYAAVVPRFITLGLAGVPLTIFGDGLQSRDFLFVEDVAEANVKAMTAAGISGHAFNVASGRETSLLDLVAAIAAALGREVPYRFAAARAGDIRRSVGNGSLARQEMGFSPAVLLPQGVAATLEHFRNE
jgi:UDP-glucose 4-epimerase